MKKSRFLILAAGLALLTIFLAAPASSAPAEELPVPSSLHQPEEIFLVKYRGANPSLKRLALIHRERGPGPILEEGERALQTARQPRQVYSAIAYDAYAKSAWECAALVLLRLEQAQAAAYSDATRQAAQTLLDEAAAYFLMSPQQRERFYAQTRAELAVADQSLNEGRIYTLFCRLRQDRKQGLVYLRPGAAREIRLADSDEDARMLVRACVEDGAASESGVCLVTYWCDADGDSRKYLSARLLTARPDISPRLELELTPPRQESERLDFKIRIKNVGDRPLRLVTEGVSRSKASIGNSKTAHFSSFGLDDFLVGKNPAGRADDDGRGVVSLAPAETYEASYSVRRRGLPPASDLLHFYGRYAIIYEYGGESLRELVELEDKIPLSPLSE